MRQVVQQYQFRQQLQSRYLGKMVDSLSGAQKTMSTKAERETDENHPGWQRSVLSAPRLETGGHQVGPGASLIRQSRNLDLWRPATQNPVPPWRSGFNRAAAFSRCGNVFFPLRQLFGLQSWTFSAAGFFPASAGFFLASDGLFLVSDGFFPLPPKCIFFCCKRCFLCCCKVFFSAALNFFPLRSGIFLLAFFSRCGKAFSRCKAFFSCCQACFFFRFRCFFPAANLCFFARLREDKELEKRRVGVRHL